MFISIEGIEGTGKSTVSNAIVELLMQHNKPVLYTREPGGTKVAESIRQILLNTYENEAVVPEVELLLMFAARLQHVETKIKPALDAGKIVICDRFVDASFAYQGGGRQIDIEKIKAITNWTIANFNADKTILLDLEPRQALARVMLRNNAKDRIESENNEFFERVRATYLELANNEPNRFLVIDASQDEQTVIQQVWQKVQEWI